MKSERRTRVSSKRYLLVACAIVLCLSQTAFAQSGRRSKAAPSPPTPVEEPKPEPTPNPSSSKPAVPRASIIVGNDRFSSSNFALSSYSGEALRACIDRLNDSRAFDAKGGSDMTRSDAINRAKKGESYVLLMEVKEDDMDGNITIGYYLYKPQTGKVATSGRVYLGTNGVGKGGVGVGIPSTSRRLPLQYQMREAGKEVADRVVGKINVPVPEERP